MTTVERGRLLFVVPGIFLMVVLAATASPSARQGEAQTVNQPSALNGPTLTVDVSAGRHRISPDIYGMNFADEALARELRLPVRRWEGNATTRYNWQNDTSNRASDWYFENIPEDNPNPSTLPDGSSADKFVEQNRRTGTKTLLTIPTIGWTPKSRDYACGFSVRKYGVQQKTDPWRPDCGNGVRPDGTNVTGNDPTDTSKRITPAFVQDWMRHLIGRYGTASSWGGWVLQPRQRADALERDPSRRSSTSDELRRVAQPHLPLCCRNQGRRPRRKDARAGGVGLDWLFLLGAGLGAGR